MTDTVTLFWTLNGNSGPVTYCTPHALVATNLAFLTVGMEPASTMEEAAVAVSMVLVLRGDPEADTFLSHSETGMCEWCEEHKAH